MRVSARFLAIPLLLLAAGCTATPDLSGWAENSARLATTIEAENRAVLDRIDQNVNELGRGKLDGWELDGFDEGEWDNWRAGYATQSAEVNAVMSTMVLYADALASLAAAGETGEDGVNSMVMSLTNIAGLVGVSFPGAGTAIEAAKALGEAWTRVQTQNSLDKAMRATSGSVDNLAAHVQKMTRAQKDIVRNAARLERELATQAAGPDEMSWYADNHETVRANAIADGADPVVAEAQLSMVLKLEQKRAERDTKRNAASRWRDERLAALDAVAAAAFAWRDSHREAAAVLAACGGVKSLKVACGNYTAANVRLAAGRLQAILDADKKRTEE